MLGQEKETSPYSKLLNKLVAAAPPFLITNEARRRRKSQEARSKRSSSNSSSRRNSTSSSKSCMTKVMSNPDLLTCIIDHLVDEHATSRGVLGQLALVNKQTWLKVCRHSVFKAPITTKRLPVTALDDGAMIKKQYQVPSLDQQCYAYIRDYGRSVLMSRQLSLYSNNNSSSKKSLEQRLRLGCEIWDSHDGMVFFSGSGPLKIIPYEKTVLLRLGGVERKEVLGPAFSALSRDPKNQRYHSMSDFFRHVHYMKSKRVGGGGSAVCIRVTVTCEETGRMSVLWDTDSEARLKITQPHASGRSYLPSGAFFARYVCLLVLPLRVYFFSVYLLTLCPTNVSCLFPPIPTGRKDGDQSLLPSFKVVITL